MSLQKKCVEFVEKWHISFTRYSGVLAVLKMMIIVCDCGHSKLTLCLPVCLLIILANNLDPDQARRFVGPDQGPNCLTF